MNNPSAEANIVYVKTEMERTKKWGGALDMTKIGKGISGMGFPLNVTTPNAKDKLIEDLLTSVEASLMAAIKDVDFSSAGSIYFLVEAKTPPNSAPDALGITITHIPQSQMFKNGLNGK